MQKTAKSLLLIDASNINISPITDLTSLYYEVERKHGDTSIIARKYIYSGFPVGVHIDPNISTNIGTIDPFVYSPVNNKLYKIVEESDNKDIIVSNISTSVIQGTTYRLLNVKNYNLSEILMHYTTRELFDSSINSINSSIKVLNTSVNELYKIFNTSICSLKELLSNTYIPNRFYIINDYYVSTDANKGCMAIPNTTNFSGPTSESIKLLVKANTSTLLDNKIYNMYDGNNKPLNVYGTYDISVGNNKKYIKITYLKDLYQNEAPYDFYNLTYKYYNEFLHTFSRIHADTVTSVKNNIIKTDPFISQRIPIFEITVESGSSSLPSDYILKILNNYIGPNNNIYICSINDNIEFTNNIIGSSNYIEFVKHDSYEGVYITNTNIQNNNTFKSIGYSYNDIVYNNINIGNNNIILTCPGEDQSYNLSNLTINYLNNITLYNNTTNDIILNNCNASINLSDNIIVDNYINTTINSSLNTTPNSVYLFGQNVYAKSFNTFKE